MTRRSRLQWPIQPQGATVASTLSGGSHHAPSYDGPGIAMLLLFLTVGSGARSIITERDNGTLARLLAGPISRPKLLIGKSIATFVLGVITVGSVRARFRPRALTCVRGQPARRGRAASSPSSPPWWDSP